MKLDDDLFKSKGFSLSLKKITCPRRGLNREEAATYIGVSPSFFDGLVKEGIMPRPIRLKGRVIWDRHQLDEAFEDLATTVINPWESVHLGRSRVD